MPTAHVAIMYRGHGGYHRRMSNTVPV